MALQSRSTAPALAPPVSQIDEYQISTVLGRGGMGQVFLGHDTLLDRPVAVKFLVTSTPSERHRKRFLIEARALARVHHPNVVAVYRVGICDGHPYLVSELVAGQSLERVAKPMPWPEVLSIGIDLARGLAAVHAHGVLHRDLKPANVMLTPEGHAKLLDFGVAKLAGELRAMPAGFRAVGEVRGERGFDFKAVEQALSAALRDKSGNLAETADATGDDEARAANLAPQAAYASTPLLDVPTPKDAHRLTDPGVMIGTPAYRPPEMWLGAPATALSDLYMLGEVLYELCCGQVPHDYLRETQIRRASVHTDPLPLRDAAPEVNSRFAKVIDSCISRNPSDRPPSAAQVLTLLEAIAADPTDEATRQRQQRKKWVGRLMPLVLAASSVIPATVILYRDARKAEEQAAPNAAPRPRVAVLGLQVDKRHSAAQTGFARTFSELLDAELSAGGKLLVLPAVLIERVKLELKLDGVEHLSGEVLDKLNRSVGPDYIVFGALRAVAHSPSRLHVEVSLRNAQTGQTVATSQVEGLPQELFTMVSALGRELRSKLGLAALSQGDRSGLQAERPATIEVAELYAEGRKRLRRFDPVGARQALSRVVEAEPDYPLGHLALSDALLALGLEADARKEIRRAFELSGRLPRAERSLIEARYHENPEEWPRAFAMYRALRTSFPDDPEYGLYLTDAQRRAGLPAEALKTVEELRRLPSRVAQDPRIDLAAAKAQMDLSDFQSALQLITRATHEAESADSPLILADALLLDSLARTNLNDFQRALRSAERARDLFASTGNLFGECEAMVSETSASVAQGDYARAEEVNERTLAILMRLGNSVLTAVHLGNMADLLCQRGKFDLANARGQAGLLLSRQVGSREATLESLVILGQVALWRGNPALAEERLLEAEQELASHDEPRMAAWVLWQKGELRRAQGRPEEAERLHRLALAQRQQYHLEGFLAESQAALATLALERSQAAEAEQLAHGAMRQFAAAQNSESAAWAQSLLSLALAQQSRTGEAQAAFLPALARISTSQNLLLRVGALAALAQSAFLCHLPAPALEQLRSQLHEVIALASRAGSLSGEVELSTLLRRLEQKIGVGQGGPEGRQSDLCGLARRALESGLGRAGKLAAALCGGTVIQRHESPVNSKL